MAMLVPCQACGAPGAIVADSRPAVIADRPAVRRRRRCPSCGARYTTFEVSADILNDSEIAMRLRLNRVRARLVTTLEELDDAPVDLSEGGAG